MKLLKNILPYLFCASVALNLFPEFWQDVHLRLYQFLDLLPIWLISIMYIVYATKYNVYYLIGLVFTIIAGSFSKYFLDYYNYAIQLYGFGIVAFILMAQKDIFKVTTKSVIIISIPFLIILASSYLYFSNEIDSIGSGSVNFYTLVLGFFLFFAGTLYYNHRSRTNLYYLISAILVMLTAFFNTFNLVEQSFNVERFVNMLFVGHQLFMLFYILKKEYSSIFRILHR
jgi:hypothetical protein